jgi:hypothetical protein
MDAVKLELDIGTTDADCKLGVKVTVDNNIIYDNPHVTETYHLSQAFSDQDNTHVLEIEMYGKLSEHTKINDAGEILSDALITMKNIILDDIDIEKISYELFEYHHDFNGTQAPIVDKFYGIFGCNGKIKLEFTSPVYLWLLNHM